jgi:hypothetical protein
LYLITSDCAVLCVVCARKEYKLIVDAIRRDDNTGGWKVIDADVNWEDPDLFCDHCSKRIESAYAEE